MLSKKLAFLVAYRFSLQNICQVCLFLVCCDVACVAQDSDGESRTSSDANLEVGGYFQSLYANNMSIRRGSVFVSVNETFDSTNGEPNDISGYSRTSEYNIRYIFDYDQDRYLLCRSRDDIHIDMEAEDDSHERLRRSTQHSGMAYYEGRLTVKRLGRRAVETEKSGMSGVLSTAGAPDFRITGFVVIDSYLPSSVFNDIVSRLSSPADVRQVESCEDGKVDFTVRSKPPFDRDFIIDDAYTFDTVRLVPLELESSGTQLRPEKVTAFNGSSRFEWEDMDGVMVPTLVEYIRPTRERINGRHESARRVTEMRFKWDSVNEDLEDELFDRRQIKDDETLIRLTDPRRAGIEQE